MTKFKITYQTSKVPVQLKKLVELNAKTPEEAYTEIAINLKKHAYLDNNIKNLHGIEQQEM